MNIYLTYTPQSLLKSLKTNIQPYLNRPCHTFYLSENQFYKKCHRSLGYCRIIKKLFIVFLCWSFEINKNKIITREKSLPKYWIFFNKWNIFFSFVWNSIWRIAVNSFFFFCISYVHFAVFFSVSYWTNNTTNYYQFVIIYWFSSIHKKKNNNPELSEMIWWFCFSFLAPTAKFKLTMFMKACYFIKLVALLLWMNKYFAHANRKI